MARESKSFQPCTRFSRHNAQSYLICKANCLQVANPVEVLGLPLSPNSCKRAFRWDSREKVSYDVNEAHSSIECEIRLNQSGCQRISSDVFLKLPNEIHFMITRQLSTQDIANLRLITLAYRPIPIILFRELLFAEMPLLWEAQALPNCNIACFMLYKKVKNSHGIA